MRRRPAWLGALLLAAQCGVAAAATPQATLLVWDGGGDGRAPALGRPALADAGFAVARTDAVDLRAAITDLRARGAAPVWLVGDGRRLPALVAPLHGEAVPDGLVLTVSARAGAPEAPVDGLPLDRLRLPVLVLQWAPGGCGHAPPSDAPALLRGLVQAPRKALRCVDGEPAGDRAAAAITGWIARGWPDWRALWDFGRPELTEQRLRERLASATGDEAIALQTQIARTLGLRRRFDEARALLQPLQAALPEAGAEAVVRWYLEWGRSFASAAHDRERLPEADREAARRAFRAAAQRAQAAGLDALAVDALHMLPFTTADRAQDLAWNREALAFALASPQPDARRWEASLRHNLGLTLNELDRPAEALPEYQAALAALERQGASPGRLRVATWMVAHTLRRLGRIDEALALQQRLEGENAAAGTPDRFVFEELALLHRARGEAALAADYEARAARP